MSPTDLTPANLHAQIALLTTNLINIKDETGHFLLRLDDGRVIDTKGWSGWEWTHGIGLYGLWKYHQLTSNPTTLAIITDWFSARLSEGTTKNINTMSPFLTLAYLHEANREPSYLPWLDAWADWAMHGLPRTPHGGMQHMTYAADNTYELWDDTLMMTVLPLAKIGLLLNRPAYVEEAKRQFLLHIQFLCDTSTGLWFHGWKFHEAAERAAGATGLGHNFARARWARGNSWVTIAIPEFIELLDLPEGDALRAHLVEILIAQLRALRECQLESGLWRTLLDVPEEEGSYAEASATAGFAYGVLKAVRKRYVGAEFKEIGEKALRATLGKINAEGELVDTSFGTGMGMDLKHYMDIERTSMPYGQAMGIMALGEGLRLFI